MCPTDDILSVEQHRILLSIILQRVLMCDINMGEVGGIKRIEHSDLRCKVCSDTLMVCSVLNWEAVCVQSGGLALTPGESGQHAYCVRMCYSWRISITLC